MAVALYGLSVRPDGTAIPYSRQVARARPHALPAICVKGLATDRTWIRGTEASHITTAGDADLLSRRLFDLQRVTPPQHVRDALASLRRAADRNESAVQRGQALWDAVEFLCAGTRVEKQFSKMEKRAIRDAVKDVQLTSDQQRRLDDALQYLNAPSLAMRMRARASADGVPLSKPEIDLLHRTRASRNDAVHGRAGATPTDPELRWAVSIVARMIMYRWHAEVVQRLP
jgi:hypothetical protein